MDGGAPEPWGKETLGLALLTVTLGEQPPREPVFKVCECSSHPFLTFILVTSLPFLHLTNPSFANIEQNISLCWADCRSTVGFGFGTDYSWVETVCRIQPRAAHSVALALSTWKELSGIEGLFWVGGLLRKACVETGSLDWTVPCKDPRVPGRGTRLLTPGHSLCSWNNQIRADPPETRC